MRRRPAPAAPSHFTPPLTVRWTPGGSKKVSDRLSHRADESDSADKPARLEAAAHALVRQLDGGRLPDSVAKKSSEWLLPGPCAHPSQTTCWTLLLAATAAAAADLLRRAATRCDAQALTAHPPLLPRCAELPRTLGAKGLLAVLETILRGLSSALALPPNAPRAYLLLPTILSHLGTVDHDEGLATAAGEPLKEGAAVAAYAVRSIQAIEWPAAALVPLATMMRDLTLPDAARRQLVHRITKRFDDVEPMQMPALVYQVRSSPSCNLPLSTSRSQPPDLHPPPLPCCPSGSDT